MIPDRRRTGLAVLSDLPWGTHLCHFYKTQADLLDTLVPYFKAGPEAKERCLWVIDEPLTDAKARRSLRQAVPESDRCLADGCLEILSSREWYLKGGTFEGFCPWRSVRSSLFLLPTHEPGSVRLGSLTSLTRARARRARWRICAY